MAPTEPERDAPSTPPSALVHLRGVRSGGIWVELSRPETWLTATRAEDVQRLLDRVERAAMDGLFAAGFITYEAAPAFDPALETRPVDGSLPLGAFALFRSARIVTDPIPPFSGTLRPELAVELCVEEQVGPDAYRHAIERVRNHIAEGDVYQVNYTFPLQVHRPQHPPHPLEARAEPSGRAAEEPSGLGDQLFRQLCRSQGGACACRLTGPGLDVVSGSPELFFERNGDEVVCRPMKGTAPRGRFLEEDEQLARALRASAKERAENLMIVDMMRNDLGRIAEGGSVTVDRLFEVERLPTLHQMTSTVRGRSRASLAEIFGALFPCASITGAPKSSAMRTIAELERVPRGVYTGAVGVVLPGSPDTLGWTETPKGTSFAAAPRPVPIQPRPYARFGVAIRTAWSWNPGTPEERNDAPYRYGVGSGVVWDSNADAELAETRSKALGLGLERPPFELLETMLLRAGTKGIRRLRLWPQHRRRLLESAEYFAFRLDADELEEQIDQICRDAGPTAQRLRLRAAVDGSLRAELEAFSRSSRPWRVAVCPRPVDSSDPFLFHKTTHRGVYTERLACCRPDPQSGLDDVVLHNEDGALTETTIANLLLPPDAPGRPWRTPPRTAGLLAGTLRAELLRRGRIAESDLSLADLAGAPRLLLINSVRGVFPATLVGRVDAPVRPECSP